MCGIVAVWLWWKSVVRAIKDPSLDQIFCNVIFCCNLNLLLLILNLMNTFHKWTQVFGHRPNSYQARICVLGFSANRVWLVSCFFSIYLMNELRCSAVGRTLIRQAVLELTYFQGWGMSFQKTIYSMPYLKIQ